MRSLHGYENPGPPTKTAKAFEIVSLGHKCFKKYSELGIYFRF